MGSLMELRHRLMMNGIPDHLRLPSAYKKIPYVTANGQQALRTNYIPVQNDEFHIRYSGHSGTLLSAGTGTYQLILLGGFANTGWYYKYFSGTTGSATFNLSPTAWHDLSIDSNGTLNVDGKTFTVPYEAPLDGTATSMFLFERRNWTTQYTGSVAEFWIKNNGEYKMYLIPCIRKSDQKVGLYDTIEKTFYMSSRSDFIAGT